MPCEYCGKPRLFHASWCTRDLKAVVLDRRQDQVYVDPYRVPASDLRDSLATAWPTDRGTSKKYPKKFNDRDHEYRPRAQGVRLFEHPYSPDMSRFDYNNQTNNKDTTENPGYGRIITTEGPDRYLQGFSRHPPKQPQILDRSPEIRSSRLPGYEKVLTYGNDCYGKPKSKKYYKTDTRYI